MSGRWVDYRRGKRLHPDRAGGAVNYCKSADLTGRRQEGQERRQESGG